MIGHLRDELARAGWGSRRDIAIYPRPRPATAPGAVRAALHILMDQSGCEEVGALIVDLADIIQRGQCAGAQDGACAAGCRVHYDLPSESAEPEQNLAAAESAGEYKSKNVPKIQEKQQKQTDKKT